MKLNASVLVVDDEPILRTILSRTLRKEGCSVTEAVDGSDALEKFEITKFDFVITDIEMPNLGGMELLTEIKSRNPETYVLLITGHKDQYSPEDLLAAGADHYLTKPFHNIEVARTIQGMYIQLMKRKRSKSHKP